eukprot:TRINITY_DN4707_c0_g1_i1.p1 TRINITY_DN4707_c0_g1~~TRINITY_DN4707_c0_g1_i1.p1  ORF type:complete len:308 (+),score=42.44 TRINITY_DN4707_c0_g1_i1:42-965(+)
MENEVINLEDDSDEIKDVCSICLGPYQQATMTDTCFHMFCFLCILQWSQMGTNPKCPLCKTSFDSLIHEVISDKEYKRTYLIEEPKQTGAINLGSVYRQRWGRRSQEYSNDAKDTFGSTGHSLRRGVYLRGLHAIPPSNSASEKLTVRSINQKKSKWEGRLRPWMTRELQAILQEEDVDMIVSLFLAILHKHAISSKEAVAQFGQWIFEHAETFCHELECFANSPLDMHSYDRSVRYDIQSNREENQTKKNQRKREERDKELEYRRLKRDLTLIDDDLIDLEQDYKTTTTLLETKKTKLQTLRKRCT